ncbi:phenylalanine--tRNA ligase alpha subunit-like [Panthera tigris]|uniref:phenylalanine--tRNA ligase alpha subunit-like n=1 Tax=Panthera tigris TaxID=9694 RepID=UPI001C6F8E71|nr:phenylalanine--tRNA ligase alpha subunit-like [Panthera tigris]
MLLSLGLPDNLCIIAWGLFLEHLIMINYGINSIQELVDHKVNLQVMCDSPLCRLNLEQDFQCEYHLCDCHFSDHWTDWILWLK